MIKRLLLFTFLNSLLLSLEIVIDTTQPLPNELKIQSDNTKEVVMNKITGLMWQDNQAAATVQKDWYGAKSYCQNLRLADYHDWYLPTIAELETIIDTSKANPAIKSGFKNIASYPYWSAPYPYWSSSPSASYSGDAWCVLFADGSSSRGDLHDNYFVRCVRAGQ